MKKVLILLISFTSLVAIKSKAQESSSFKVNGDLDKFYPVTFFDGNWGAYVATELNIGRADVHIDGNWRGSLIATFKYHCFQWGNGSDFIDAKISSTAEFIAGWRDVTYNNGSARIIIWLKGGGTTYYYKSNAEVSPVVYDGVQNALPFQEENGPQHSFKTSIDGYVNSNGITLGNSLVVNGNMGIGTGTPNAYEHGGNNRVLEIYNPNTVEHSQSHLLLTSNTTAANSSIGSVSWYIPSNPWSSVVYIGAHTENDRSSVSLNFATSATTRLVIGSNGNVGIGTLLPAEKLSVNGNIRSRKVIVTQSGWPDYVFEPTYQLPSLDSVHSFIKENKHLPEIPSAATIEKDGHDLGEVQKLLLKKVEELTLYMIELKKENEKLQLKNDLLEKEILEIKKTINN